jgi:hypothetical protein
MVMNYLDELGAAIQREVDPAELPSDNTASLFRLYAVLLLAKGEGVTVEDVHNAWSAWMSEHDPAHRSLKPFSELSPDVQQADQPYTEAIRAVARAYRGQLPLAN